MHAGDVALISRGDEQIGCAEPLGGRCRRQRRRRGRRGWRRLRVVARHNVNLVARLLSHCVAIARDLAPSGLRHMATQ
eukprot:5565442-Prymnesium_polylepis.2